MADITIDLQSISSFFHGDVLDYEVGQNEMSDMVLTTSFNPRPIPLAGTIGSKRISLVIDFRENGSNTADQAISTFMEYLVSKNESASYIELNLQDGFGYTCSFYSADTPERKTSSITQCKVTLVGFRHMPERSYTKTADGTYTISQKNLNNDTSCRPTPLYIKYTPPTGIVNFTLKLDGAYIHCENISGYIELDGLNGTVKDSQGNAFHKTDLTVFPFYKGTGGYQWNVRAIGGGYLGGNIIVKCKPIVL